MFRKTGVQFSKLDTASKEALIAKMLVSNEAVDDKTFPLFLKVIEDLNKSLVINLKYFPSNSQLQTVEVKNDQSHFYGTDMDLKRTPIIKVVYTRRPGMPESLTSRNFRLLLEDIEEQIYAVFDKYDFDDRTDFKVQIEDISAYRGQSHPYGDKIGENTASLPVGYKSHSHIFKDLKETKFYKALDALTRKNALFNETLTLVADKINIGQFKARLHISNATLSRVLIEDTSIPYVMFVFEFYPMGQTITQRDRDTIQQQLEAELIRYMQFYLNQQKCTGEEFYLYYELRISPDKTKQTIKLKV